MASNNDKLTDILGGSYNRNSNENALMFLSGLYGLVRDALLGRKEQFSPGFSVYAPRSSDGITHDTHDKNLQKLASMPTSSKFSTGGGA